MPRNGMLHIVSGEHGEWSAVAAVDEYWDVVASAQLPPVGLIDDLLAETIQRIDELTDAPLPDAAFAAQLEAQLLGPARQKLPEKPVPGFGASSAPAPAMSLGTHWTERTRKVALNIAAAAALLALVIASSLVSLRISSLKVHDETGVPLVVAPGVTDERLLLEARFEKAPDGIVSPALSRWVLQPRAEVTVGADFPAAAPAAYLIETGELSLRADAPVSVTRDGETTPIPTANATWTTLLPGDRFYAPEGVSAQWRNAGSRSVRILEASFASRDVSQQPAGVARFPVIIDPTTTRLEGPLTMRVIEVTLLPNGVLPANLVPGLVMMKVESGRLVAVDIDGDGNSLPPVELGQATRYLGSFPPGRVFRSSNDAPVRLLLVTLAGANLLETRS